MQRAVRLRTFYPKRPSDSLNWSQYRVIIECNDPAERKRLHQLALDRNLPARDLSLARQAGSGDVPIALERPTDTSYLYIVTVNNIIDGDTFDFQIDLGFEVLRNGRFRLADIDCPELPSKAARAARDYAFSRLMSARTIVAKTLRRDIHGRYVSHLFYSPDDLTIHDCFHHATHLNNELVTTGHAQRVV